MAKRDAAGTLQPEKPEGMSDAEWSFRKRIGNDAFATAILAVDDGRYPADDNAVADMLSVARGEETRALKHYLALRKRYGGMLDAARREVDAWRARSLGMFTVVTTGERPAPPQDEDA